MGNATRINRRRVDRGEKSRWRAARPRESNLVETIAISNSRFFGIFAGILRVTECVYSASSGLCQRIPRTAWTRVGAAFGRKGPSARRRGALSFRVGPTFFFSLSFSPLFHSTPSLRCAHGFSISIPSRKIAPIFLPLCYPRRDIKPRGVPGLYIRRDRARERFFESRRDT